MTTTATGREPTRDEKFVTRLAGLLADSGAMAALRRGLGKSPGTAAEMHPYILPWLGADDPPWQENAYYQVASLFAYWHQGKDEITANAPENLGASFAWLRDESESIEKRFVAMLNSHFDDLSHHLRHTVGLLKSRDVPVDWARLLGDLRRWDWESRSVQRDWARGFWHGSAKETEATPAAVSDT